MLQWLEKNGIVHSSVLDSLERHIENKEQRKNIDGG